MPQGAAHMGIHQRPVIMAHKGNGDTVAVFKYIPYLLEYKSHFFVPENQSKNGGATYTRG